jgi:hypothetical protein
MQRQASYREVSVVGTWNEKQQTPIQCKMPTKTPQKKKKNKTDASENKKNKK